MKAVKEKQRMRGRSRHVGSSITHGLIRFENGAMFCHFPFAILSQIEEDKSIWISRLYKLVAMISCWL